MSDVPQQKSEQAKTLDFTGVKVIGLAGGGIVSINADVTPAQVVGAGTGISVVDFPGTGVHQVNNLGVLSVAGSGVGATGAIVLGMETGPAPTVIITEAPAGNFTFSTPASNFQVGADPGGVAVSGALAQTASVTIAAGMDGNYVITGYCSFSGAGFDAQIVIKVNGAIVRSGGQGMINLFVPDPTVFLVYQITLAAGDIVTLEAGCVAGGITTIADPNALQCQRISK